MCPFSTENCWCYKTHSFKVSHVACNCGGIIKLLKSTYIYIYIWIRVMVFNANSTIFQLYIMVVIFFWWRKPDDPQKTKDLSQVTDKLYQCWSRFKLTTSVVIGTDSIGSCKLQKSTTHYSTHINKYMFRRRFLV